MTIAAHCTDLPSLAKYLGFAPQHLFYLVKLKDDLYRSISIPKKSNPIAVRNIDIPITELKGVQRVILRRILEDQNVSKHAYAYVAGKSVCEAARRIVGRKSVLKVDLKEFFPSISEKRVYGLYKSMNFNSKVAFILTQLCTYRGRLCQGSPTSPYISNLICVTLDKDLSKLAASWGLDYIRYSDDLLYQRHKFLTLGGFPFGFGCDSRHGEGDSPWHRVFSFETIMTREVCATWPNAAGIRARSVGFWRWRRSMTG